MGTVRKVHTSIADRPSEGLHHSRRQLRRAPSSRRQRHQPRLQLAQAVADRDAAISPLLRREIDSSASAEEPSAAVRTVGARNLERFSEQGRERLEQRGGGGEPAEEVVFIA